MKKIILSLIAVMASLSISAQTVHNAIKIYKGNSTTPVETYINTNDSKYRVELGTTTVTHDLEIWANEACTEKPVVGQKYETLYAKFNKSLSNYYTFTFGVNNSACCVWGYDVENPENASAVWLYCDFVSGNFDDHTFSQGQVVQCYCEYSYEITDDLPLYADFPVSSWNISGTSCIGIGGSTTLNIGDATDATVEWSSSNQNVATVNASTGVVTGVAEGTAYITASITGDDGSIINTDYEVTVTVTE